MCLELTVFKVQCSYCEMYLIQYSDKYGAQTSVH